MWSRSGVADDDGIHVPARQHGNLAVLGDRLTAPLVEAAVEIGIVAEPGARRGESY
jgi:hypothetical protein